MTTTHQLRQEELSVDDQTISQLVASNRDLRLCLTDVADTQHRPPVFDEMKEDITLLIRRVCTPFIDQTCVQLTLEELEAECWRKVAMLLDRGLDQKIDNRTEFFAYLKTTINNHVKGLVQKFRFTIKRTGIRPPDKGDRFSDHHKPIEISLDDPDAHLQVGDEPVYDYDESCANDFQAILSPLQILVFRQLHVPNQESANLAKMEMWATGRLTYKVSVNHLADGIGIPVDLFLQVRRQVAEKFKEFMSDDLDLVWNSSIAFLSREFNVEVPPSTDRVVIKRLFSLAARVMYSKVESSVELRHHLKAIGARVPEDNGIGLNCYGVLFESGNPKCENCGYRDSCIVETRSLGLDKVTPSPHLLGSRANQRFPAINIESDEVAIRVARPKSTTSVPLPTVPMEETNDTSVRTVEIIDFLRNHFRVSKIKARTRGQKPKEAYVPKNHGNVSPIMWYTPSESFQGGLSLRFTRPSSSVASKLARMSNGFYLPVEMSLADVKKLVNQHANEKSPKHTTE